MAYHGQQQQQDPYPHGFRALLNAHQKTPCFTPAFVRNAVELCNKTLADPQGNKPSQNIESLFDIMFDDEIKEQRQFLTQYIEEQQRDRTPQPSPLLLSRPALSLTTSSSSITGSRQSEVDTNTPMSSALPSVGGYGRRRGNSVASSRGKGQNSGSLSCPSCYNKLSNENTTARRHLRTCVKALVCSHCKKYRTGDKTRFTKHQTSCEKKHTAGRETPATPATPSPQRRNIAQNERQPCNHHCQEMCRKITETDGLDVEYMIRVINDHYRKGCTDQNCRRSQHTTPAIMSPMIPFTINGNRTDLSEMGQWQDQELEPELPQQSFAGSSSQQPTAASSPLNLTPDETNARNNPFLSRMGPPTVVVTDADAYQQSDWHDTSSIDYMDQSIADFDFNAMAFSPNQHGQDGDIIMGSYNR